MAQARPCWSRLGVPEFVDHSATLLGKGIRPENAMLRRQWGAAVGGTIPNCTPRALTRGGKNFSMLDIGPTSGVFSQTDAP